jgi:hypothetical protein
MVLRVRWSWRQKARTVSWPASSGPCSSSGDWVCTPTPGSSALRLSSVRHSTPRCSVWRRNDAGSVALPMATTGQHQTMRGCAIHATSAFRNMSHLGLYRLARSAGQLGGPHSPCVPMAGQGAVCRGQAIARQSAPRRARSLVVRYDLRQKTHPEVSREIDRVPKNKASCRVTPARGGDRRPCTVGSLV